MMVCPRRARRGGGGGGGRGGGNAHGPRARDSKALFACHQLNYVPCRTAQPACLKRLQKKSAKTLKFPPVSSINKWVRCTKEWGGLYGSLSHMAWLDQHCKKKGRKPACDEYNRAVYARVLFYRAKGVPVRIPAVRRIGKVVRQKYQGYRENKARVLHREGARAREGKAARGHAHALHVLINFCLFRAPKRRISRPSSSRAGGRASCRHDSR